MRKNMSQAFIAASIGMWIGLMATIAFGADAMKPLATCRDGKVEYSSTGRHNGACAGHGGVAKWADGSPVKSHTRTTEYK